MANTIDTSAQRHIDIALLFLRKNGFIIERHYNPIEDEMGLYIKYPDGSKIIYKGKLINA